MSPRPIHRTLLFWLGVPGLIFCLWAWIRSNFHGTVIIAQIPHRFFCQFTSAAGSLEYIFLTSEAGSAFGTLTYEQSSAIEPAWFPPAIVPTDPITDPFDAPEHYTLVAWWLITLVYTLLWTAAIFASRRRQRRLLENTPSLAS